MHPTRGARRMRRRADEIKKIAHLALFFDSPLVHERAAEAGFEARHERDRLARHALQHKVARSCTPFATASTMSARGQHVVSKWSAGGQQVVGGWSASGRRVVSTYLHDGAADGKVKVGDDAARLTRGPPLG